MYNLLYIYIYIHIYIPFTSADCLPLALEDDRVIDRRAFSMDPVEEWQYIEQNITL